ncbi:hypothetical protein GH714_009561 [Hevea brasiliensis]|uniref:BURP domain-containing protein n=1 Tax=Hevea brasiliensis TaxID=3981 RepID=A0A6A6KZ55_HEVBR|nr:hypothetical protein GH714_009561 [Hevea brasiliensis]
MQCGHSNGAARDVPMQDHFHISTNDVIKNTSLQLYYKILNELYKRPRFIIEVPKLGKGFDNFVADFVEASYIGVFTPAVKLVKVSLRGESGDKVEAIAICHTDSSRWEHDHIVFRLLQVKPGSPVCHFLPAGHLVWVQSPASKAS